jgi:hypothetical protein
VGQSALCFLAGRSSKFPQLFAVTQSCRGNYLINLRVSCPFFFFTCSYKTFGCFQFQISGYCILVVKVFRFLMFIVIIVSGMCTSMYLSFLNWVCWVRGNFSGEQGPAYISCFCLRCVERRAGTSIFGHFSGAGGGTVRIFYPLWLCSGGYGTIEMVKGLVRVCFAFFSLLSVLLAVGYLR